MWTSLSAHQIGNMNITCVTTMKISSAAFAVAVVAKKVRATVLGRTGLVETTYTQCDVVFG